jgi:hypothetical protein
LISPGEIRQINILPTNVNFTSPGIYGITFKASTAVDVNLSNNNLTVSVIVNP